MMVILMLLMLMLMLIMLVMLMMQVMLMLMMLVMVESGEDRSTVASWVFVHSLPISLHHISPHLVKSSSSSNFPASVFPLLFLLLTSTHWQPHPFPAIILSFLSIQHKILVQH